MDFQTFISTLSNNPDSFKITAPKRATKTKIVNENKSIVTKRKCNDNQSSDRLRKKRDVIRNGIRKGFQKKK